jgi:branched-chain amino acid transport system permease protein
MRYLKFLPILFLVAYALAALLVSNSYYQLVLTFTAIWACFGLSWNVFSGYSGLVSFGHAAFFGLGAYATVLAQTHFGWSPWVMLPISGLIGALAALIIGFPTFRLRGHYFAFAMLAYPLALLYVFQWLGLQEVTFPMVRDRPSLFMQFADHRIYSLLALALLLFFLWVNRAVERSRFGVSLMAIKQNEAAAEAAGIDTLRWKLYSICLSGCLAGICGSFYAVVLLVVTPESVFGMLVSAQALTVAVFGGVGSIWGPVIGAAVLIPLSESLQAAFGAQLPGIQGVVLGVAIVAVILAAPEGIFWKVRDLLHFRSAGNVDEVSERVELAAVPTQLGSESDAGLSPLVQAVENARSLATADTHRNVILHVEGISKRFGGLRAVHDVSFDVYRGMILGIIGPNGAGKTTLFNLLNGFLAPDGGEIVFNDANMLGKKPHLMCRAGMARTFQVMRPFKRASVLENVKVGAYNAVSRGVSVEAIAGDAIAKLGLEACADRIAGTLTTKELRLMELARAVASRPDLLLLDETLAGLGKDESDELIARIRALASAGITIVIIEHTMHAMVQLVDEFVVLDHGEVLTRGDPEIVTHDRRVIEAYLGKRWSDGNAASR